MMDIKIGTTHVTIRCRAENGVEKKLKKEAKTTIPIYGFNIVGYRLRDSYTGKVIETFRKPPYQNYEESIHSIVKLFTCTSQEP